MERKNCTITSTELTLFFPPNFDSALKTPVGLNLDSINEGIPAAKKLDIIKRPNKKTGMPKLS